ncbi:hypothetical protein [Hymenobacter lucidus]|uniref:Uncharacterized protein n=1 Tax=Hymenobacter lucidus TaxID=2880930 RepID=A0ABS8AQD7_9BACT|nr:hypothetical protein [Hymenobacter lucidus]MCB2408430.1 hypothetical protein [Hymenobacter lucidus]
MPFLLRHAAFLAILSAATACDAAHEQADLGYNLVILQDPAHDELSLNYRISAGGYLTIKTGLIRCAWATPAYVLLQNFSVINSHSSFVYYLLPVAKANPQDVQDALIGPLGKDSVAFYLGRNQLHGAKRYCF